MRFWARAWKFFLRTGRTHDPSLQTTIEFTMAAGGKAADQKYCSTFGLAGQGGAISFAIRTVDQ
jgi:hypothetical protein